MILSVSRRTDIPAFYADWFYNRVKEGFVYVRNPMNVHQVSLIPVTPDIVDCIVFWTKNPASMLSRLDEIDHFNYYFQFTINPYDQELEVRVPAKNGLIETFKKLSDRIGSKRVIWRYDPVLLTDRINPDYHVKYFEAIARKLSSYTQKCAVSFIDFYRKTKKNLSRTTARELNQQEIFTISEKIAGIAESYQIEVQSCAEKYNLESLGIKRGKCIDHALIEDIAGFRIKSGKDKNQRKECGCIESIDIGEYNTCLHDCLYCYANSSRIDVLDKKERHHPDSPLLTGEITGNDIVRKRQAVSLKISGLF